MKGPRTTPTMKPHAVLIKVIAPANCQQPINHKDDNKTPIIANPPCEKSRYFISPEKKSPTPFKTPKGP